MEFRLNPNSNLSQSDVISMLEQFSATGKMFIDGKRNKIKLFELNGRTLNVKSFKVPHLVNRIIYRYFRKSKARRSFEFANKLLENGIGTPEPIAYLEHTDWIGLKDSYYVSEHLAADLTYRELVEIPNYPDGDNILRQFTRFSYLLHQKGIEFKDHSPGNTLIKKNGQGTYDFFLVDLNRMEFHREMPFELRMKNLCRLTPHKEMVAVMSNEYAKVSGESEEKIFTTLWKMTADFQYRYYRKKRIKKKLKFWK
ncbi:Kdo domain containing protein [Flavobacterium silvisoli]|uniref:Kdo domain containing protein n=1 Tax=Flavobacterium silvisoli TaxID=2529433 RepID=A0A4Q9Z323_9FLAO|nr:Kdo domain containing protein [Flavobacterium silvisoli]TBX68774.1 Kdo domain containing protein [Flavobacterium silvisoli]